MAEHTAAEIAALLGAAGRGECNLQAREIAVLVSSRRQAAVVRGELARRKVASVYLSMRDSVFETWQARDLLIILRAVAQPSASTTQATPISSAFRVAANCTCRCS